MASVEIEATYVGSQPLVSVIEANLDFEEVVVIRHEYAVKTITPLDLLITVPTGFLLTKFVLEPLIGQYAEKWKQAVQRWLSPIQSFNLTIKLTEDNLLFEAPLESSHNLTSEIWQIIYKTLEILRSENRLHTLAKIRFTPNESGDLLILCYDQTGLTRMVDIDKSESTERIDKDALPLEEQADIIEKWQQEIERQADTYRKYIEDMKRSSDD